MIDSHQHYWDKERFHYPWLMPTLGCLYNTFLPEDLAPLVRAAGVDKTVVVQAMSSLEEMDFLLSLAEANEFIGGVVGWVDLTASNLNQTLDELCKRSKLKGVRHQIEDEPNREWLLQPSVIQGLRCVAEHGLCFDALLKQDQLWQLKTITKEIPALKIVVDHAAKPDIAKGKYDEWAGRIVEVAKLPVYCKLSGLLTEADHDSWTTEDILPYAQHVLNSFGANRVMFGSDWPVSTMAADYQTSVNTALRLLQDLTPEERECVMDGNARRFYGIEGGIAR